MARYEGTGSIDFALLDTRGQTVRLSDFRKIKHVVLIFNRGLQ